MPAVIPLAMVAASAIGSAISSHEQAKGATQAADTTAKASTDAAQLQDDASKRQLAYEQQQSDISNANAEVNRKANYDQYVAQRQRVGNVASMLGGTPGPIPAYTPGVYTSSQIGTPPAGGPPPSGTPPTGTPPATGTTPPPDVAGPPQTGTADPVTAAALKNYQALGVAPTGPGSGPTDIAYYVQKINETGGLTQQNQQYWFGPNGRIATDLAKAKGGGAGSGAPPAPQSPYTTGTLGSMAGAPTIAPMAAAASPIYQRQNPYQTGSIGGLAYQG